MEYLLLIAVLFYVYAYWHTTTYWKSGRQAGCLYKKRIIYSFKLLNWGFDAYLLKYKKGTKLPFHKDKVDNGEHWRLNVRLKGEDVFYLENDKGKRNFGNFSFDCSMSSIHLFRSDILLHGLYAKSDTTKISFGFVKFES